MRKRFTGVMAILLPEQKQNSSSLIASPNTNPQEISLTESCGHCVRNDDEILNPPIYRGRQVQNDEHKKITSHGNQRTLNSQEGIALWEQIRAAYDNEMLNPPIYRGRQVQNDEQKNKHQSLHKRPLWLRFRWNRNSNMCNLFERSRSSSVAMMKPVPAPQGGGLNKKNLLLAICLFICLLLNIAKAQPIKPLSIGDTVPDIALKNILNSPFKESNLSFYKNKLIIIDFWSTTCSSCIELLPHLDSFQKQFNESLQIIPVTYEKQSLVKKFLQNHPHLSNVHLPIVTDDTVLSRYFLHQTIPHEVWINGAGVVKAITTAQYVKAANIEFLLNGNEPRWTVKNDMQYDYSKQLMPASSNKEQPIYYTAFFPYQKGVTPAFGRITDTVHQTKRSYYINMSVLSLYKIAWPQLAQMPANRIVYELKDKSKLYYDTALGYKDAWYEQNGFCYETLLPINTTDGEQKELLKQGIDRFFHLNAGLEKRKIACLLLIRLQKNDSLLQKAFYHQPKNTDTVSPVIKFRNSPIEWLVSSINNNATHLPPVIDSTTYNGKINMDLAITAATTTEDLNAALKPYGLALIPAIKELDVFVISEKHI